MYFKGLWRVLEIYHGRLWNIHVGHDHYHERYVWTSKAVSQKVVSVGYGPEEVAKWCYLLTTFDVYLDYS